MGRGEAEPPVRRRRHDRRGQDLTPKLEVNTPPAPFGGSTDYAFSPDGKELAFTAEPLKDLAWSTNTDIWTVPVEGGEPKNLTEANPGADAQPAYSPDGKWLAYVSQARAGFESDQWVLTVRDRETRDEPIDADRTTSIDRSSRSPGSGNGRTLPRRSIDDAGTEPIVRSRSACPRPSRDDRRIVNR